MVRTNDDVCSPLLTYHQNTSFLEGPKAALVASKDFENGHYQKTPQFGIRAFGRVYCAWAYGQTVRFLLNYASCYTD